MQWTFSAENTEARKFNVIGKVKFRWLGTWPHQSTFTQVDHATKDRIVVQALLRVAQHIIGAVDTLHLRSTLRSSQVGMVAPRKLAVGSFDRVAIGVYGNAENTVVVLRSVHSYIVSRSRFLQRHNSRLLTPITLCQPSQPPHIPRRERPIRTPHFSTLQQLLARWANLQPIGRPYPFHKPQVINREYIRSPKAENQRHLCRPPADPLHHNQPVDDLLILKFTEPLQVKSSTGNVFGQVAYIPGLLRGETNSSELLVFELEECLWRDATVCKSSAESRQNRICCLHRDLLRDDCINKRLEEIWIGY